MASHPLDPCAYCTILYTRARHLTFFQPQFGTWESGYWLNFVAEMGFMVDGSFS